MADIQKRVTSGGIRWHVRYRRDSRRQRKKSFERKVDAQRFAASVETDLMRGDWIDPDRGRELRRLSGPIARDDRSTQRSCRSWPSSGKLEWQSKPVRNIRDVMRMIFKLAVRSGALKTNPVIDVPCRAADCPLMFHRSRVLA